MSTGKLSVTYQGPDHLRLALCTVCKRRINMPVDPECCKVCADSANAEWKRGQERNGSAGTGSRRHRT